MLKLVTFYSCSRTRLLGHLAAVSVTRRSLLRHMPDICSRGSIADRTFERERETEVRFFDALSVRSSFGQQHARSLGFDTGFMTTKPQKTGGFCNTLMCYLLLRLPFSSLPSKLFVRHKINQWQWLSRIDCWSMTWLLGSSSAGSETNEQHKSR
jgi:hypothetical protein